MLFGGVWPFTNLDTRVQIQEYPPVASRRTVEESNVQIVMTSRGSPVNPTQAVAVNVVPDTSSANGSFWGIGARSPLAPWNLLGLLSVYVCDGSVTAP